MPFDFKDLDLTLSLRRYFIVTPIRDNKSLPYLYPAMQDDKLQQGVRLGNLHPEEDIPCFPCIGLTKGGLFERRGGYNGYERLIYGYFLDAAIKKNNVLGHYDRTLTIYESENFSNDLRLLLTDEKFFEDIPYYEHDETGQVIAERGRMKILQRPLPRIITTGALSPVSSLKLNVAFQIEVVLTNSRDKRS